MSEKAYEVAHLDELDSVPLDDEGLLLRPVRRRLGITAFGTNAFTAEKGTSASSRSTASRTATRSCTSSPAAARRSSSATTRSTRPPDVRPCRAGHEARRSRDRAETAVLVIGAKPGVPYEISAATPRDKWIDVDDQLSAELRDRLAKLGYEGNVEDMFTRWTWKENLEDHVDGMEQIDPVVLETLRSRT